MRCPRVLCLPLLVLGDLCVWTLLGTCEALQGSCMLYSACPGHRQSLRWPPLLTGARPSISSKKMMEGWQRLASANSMRSCLSASPTHLDSTSAPCA